MSTPQRFPVADGRMVEAHTENDGSRAVLFFHAAPGSGAFDPDPSVTERFGVRLLAPDRPGYGGSDPVGPGSWASVDSAADDAAALLDREGLASVGAIGWSAGGRVALALAARRPDLVARAAIVATPAPHEEVPWIPPEQAAGVDALRGHPPEQVHAVLDEQLAALVPADPASAEALGPLGASDADAAALDTDGVRERLATMLAESYRQGATGMAQDIAGYTLAPWGFAPADVQQPVLLVYGADDPAIGDAHASWWESALPDARSSVVAGAGHFVVIPKWADILDFIVRA
jgi:pimeloyl-ACP methyl ester carboxylesterase